MRHYREAVDFAQLQKKFTNISLEQIESSLCRAIIRMDLRKPNEEILLALATGSLKRELMQTTRYTVEEIDGAVAKLQRFVDYFNFPKEEEYLRAKINDLALRCRMPKSAID